MLTVEKVDVEDRAQVKRFIDIPYRLYKNDPRWVPPLRMDIATMLNPKKHPFYEHSEAEFFIAVRDGRDIGRIAAIENTRFNAVHDTKEGEFYFFDTEDDSEAAAALFNTVFEWADGRGLNAVIGPKGLSPFDPYGILQRGYEHRQTMTMLAYNFPYYVRLAEENGFTKEVDFISHVIDSSTFVLDPRIPKIADRAAERSQLRVHRFSSRLGVYRWAERIARTYNDSFVDNWEYVPLTEAEIKFVVKQIIPVARPDLLKLIVTEDEDPVGFVLTFPDVSGSLQRMGGHLLSRGTFALVRELRTTNWVVANGIGILPEYQRRGGNALLYRELAEVFQRAGFDRYELIQVAETAVQMRKDLANIGGIPHKNHRVYRRTL
jgi:GNAT superfamily N-acetyltransferase